MYRIRDIALHTKPAFLACGVLCLLVLSACSDSNTSSPNGSIQTTVLTSCVDTDSCASNPNLQIGMSRPAGVLIPSDYKHQYPLSAHYCFYTVLALAVSCNPVTWDLARALIHDSLCLFFPTAPRMPMVEISGMQHRHVARRWKSKGRLMMWPIFAASLKKPPRHTVSMSPGSGCFGHSNGAFMALRMACEASDVITSVVSLAGINICRGHELRPGNTPG